MMYVAYMHFLQWAILQIIESGFEHMAPCDFLQKPMFCWLYHKHFIEHGRFIRLQLSKL